MQITDPEILARAQPGEVPWEGFNDDQIIFQRDCPDCDRGLLLAPARFCPTCNGGGFLTRTEKR